MRNKAAVAHAKRLIREGKVDITSRWSFDAADGAALLGDPADWQAYGSWFLLMEGGRDAQTKAYYKYPFGKGGKLYRSALAAIRQRASQQNETDLFAAAGELLKELDQRTEQAAREAGTEGVPFDAERFRAAAMTRMDAAPTGMLWEAVLIAPGLSRSDPAWYWTGEVLQAAAESGVFNGVDVNAYQIRADLLSHLPLPDIELLEDVKRYLAAQKVGTIERSWYDAGRGLMGAIRFLDAGKWVPDGVRQAQATGSKAPFGLSIDARAKGIAVHVQGARIMWATGITGASSVDVVTYPAAGGRFERAIGAQPNKERIMNREQILKMLQKHRPDLLDGKDVDALGDAELQTLVQMAMKPPKEKKGGGDGGEPGTNPADDPAEPAQRASQAAAAANPQGLTPEQIEAKIKQAVQETEQRAACGRTLDATLAGADLPALAATRLRKQFEGRIFLQSDLDQAIKDEKEYLAAMSGPAPEPVWGDQTRASGGIGAREKIGMAVDQLFGLSRDDITALSGLRRLDGRPFFEGMRAAQDYDALQGIPAPRGIRELYVLVTGDHEVTGQFDRQGLSADLRAAQDVNSGTFSYLLGNTLARRLVRDYNETDFGESLLLSIRKSVRDFRQQEAVLVGYFGDLSTVDPETEDYQEIAGVTDEESTYSLGQKGNLLTFTRKLIINDDVSIVQRLVSRLGRAARRTHAKYVWAFFTANATCSDGTAWFTAPHGNLGATALSFSTALTAYLALAGMTEKDSGETIGLLDNPAVQPTLVYPSSLMATAEAVVNDEFYYASDSLAAKARNALKGKIKGRQVSLLSDTNDWGLLLPASLIDMIEMGYLNGREQPEMFLADRPTEGQVFLADKIKYKIRHEYAGALIDYRSGYKAVVA